MTTQADVPVPVSRFDPTAYPRLVRTSFHADLASTGEVAFGYALAGPGGTVEFTERLVLPLPETSVPARVAAATAVLHLAHAVAGVSYAKASAATTIDLGDLPVTGAELVLLRGVYRDGLHEFAYTNDLPAVLDANVVGETEPDPGHEFVTWDPRRPLVPCGGGKDSIVSLEALRRSGHSPVSFVVNPNEITRSVVQRSKTPLLAVTRRIDPLLLELNESGAHNGHIPVTAINSLLAIAVSVLHGLGPVVMSNESSASAPNLTWHGRPVNHQWSKGIDAERLIRAAVASRLGRGDRYFSLLRHLNELSIGALFAGIPTSSGYDDVVTSCNRAFTITRSAGVRWCRDCPKCRFVFLALATSQPAARVTRIFGGDMLRDEAQLDGYRELLGLKDFKPFECVGELHESVSAAASLADRPDWQDAQVVVALNAQIAATGTPVRPLADVLAEHGPTLAPQAYLDALRAL